MLAKLGILDRHISQINRPNLHDAATGRIHLHAEHLIGRAGRQAETAVDTGIERLPIQADQCPRPGGINSHLLYPSHVAT